MSDKSPNRSGPACLNSFTPRDKETAGDCDRCRVVHGGAAVVGQAATWPQSDGVQGRF